MKILFVEINLGDRTELYAAARANALDFLTKFFGRPHTRLVVLDEQPKLEDGSVFVGTVIVKGKFLDRAYALEVARRTLTDEDLCVILFRSSEGAFSTDTRQSQNGVP